MSTATRKQTRTSRLRSRIRGAVSTRPCPATVSAHFNHKCEDVVVASIGRCTAVVGCVAWLRSPKILKALERVPCTLAITNDVNLPAQAYSKLQPHLPKLPAVSKVGLARGRRRELMHHKFIVGYTPEPSFVITGSFNYTQNSAYANLDNVVVVENTEIAKAYLKEAMAILDIARPVAVTRKRKR